MVDRAEAERLLQNAINTDAKLRSAGPARYGEKKRQAAEARAAVLAAMTVPEGWKLVPVEPTSAMLQAADAVVLTDEQMHAGPYELQRAEYKAAIAAAPEVPS